MPTHPPAEPGSPDFRRALRAVEVFGGAEPAIPLTPRQLAAMRVLVELTDLAGGVPPTLAELAAELDAASKSAVARLLTAIEERGWIVRTPGRARAIMILRRPRMPEEPVFVLSPALAAAQGAPPEPPAAA